jgi:hypothetical protein
MEGFEDITKAIMEKDSSGDRSVDRSRYLPTEPTFNGVSSAIVKNRNE